MRHPAVVVMSALLNGLEVKIGDTTYAMGDRHDLCWVGLTDKGEKRYVVVLGADLPYFVKLCESMTTEESMIVSANNSLNAIASKRA